MSYGSLRQRTQEAAAAPAVDDRRCYAAGCPCTGSMSVEGGKWVCAIHSSVAMDAWPRLTEKVREHDWLVAFVDDIAKMNRAGDDWRGFAAQFWSKQDEYCMPHAKETAASYGLRMRAEVLYRCGLSRRPAVRLPQPIKVRGNAAAALGRNAA